MLRFLVAILLCTSYSAHVFGQSQVNSYNDKGLAKAVYSADQSMLATADGKNIKFYTSGTLTLLHEYKVNNKDITALALSGGKALIGGYGNFVRIVDIESGEYTQPIFIDGDIKKSSHQKVEKIEFIDANRAAVIYSNSFNILDLDLESFTEQKIFDFQLRAMSFGQQENQIFIGGGNKEVVKLSLQNLGETESLFPGENWILSIDTDVEGNYMAVGYENSIVKIFIMEENELVATIEDFKGSVTDVEFSADGQYLAMTSSGGICHFYSMKDQRVSLTLDKFGNELLGISFNRNGREIVTVEKFQRVRTWDVTPLNISSIYDFKDEDDKTGPSIYISNPPNITNDRVTVSDDLIRLQGVAIDESGVKNVSINKISTPLKENGNFTINLPLTMGENFVNIEVTDINDNISVKRFIVNRKNLDGEAYDPIEATNYLFIVGINKYEYWPKLFNAVRDAEHVANVLIGSYGYNFSDVTMLLDEKATANNIYQTLRGLIEKVTPQDNLTIYYSGHGYFDDLLNEGYWVPYDADVGATGEYMSNSNLLKILNNINSQHTFLVVDACFSGSLFAQQTRGYTDNVEKYKSRWGLASGRLETVSDGAYGTNSPFATKFIEFLKNTEENEFPVSQLVQYVKIEVANETNQTPIGNPIKSLGDEGGEMVFRKKN